jgi:hypothetical protein
VTTLTDAAPATAVSRAMVHALVDYVVAKGYRPEDGALGIRGQLGSAEPLAFEHQGRAVRVVGCESALAVREALLDRPRDGWLVIVTDRDEPDLGAGLLAHLLGQQLRRPDPWQAVRQRFRAVSIDAQLTAERGHKEIAVGLLEASPAAGWPAATAGVLTRDHAYGSVARALLELPEGPVDLVSVLGWTTRTTLPTRIVELRERAGDPLTDAVLRWVAAAAGPVAALVAHVLGSGRPTDLVPFGLVVDVLDQAPDEQRSAAGTALARLTHHWGRDHEDGVRLVAPVARTVTAGLLSDRHRQADARQAIDRAEALVREAGAEDLTLGSDLLPSGLTRRFSHLADPLSRDPVRRRSEIESAWLAVDGHALSPGDPRTGPFHAAVRLARWLAGTGTRGPSGNLAALAQRQVEVDGWVDSAVNDAAAGVDDPELGVALAAVLDAARQVRDRHDVEFATALARGTADESGAGAGYLEHDGGRTYLLERVLPDVVLPLARPESPVLLLVLDGLSTGVATEVLERLLGGTRPRWAEQLLPGCDRRAGGLAVLPTTTEISRASLLTGTLTRGEQAVELKGYQALTRAHGLSRAALFHKRILDTTRLGFSISDEVRSAIDDPEIALVTCVLNTIDDALDRSDPAGTSWTADAVKHLEPLLERARSAGRRVVITADHGHVVERRLGTQRLHGAPGPARHRPTGDPVEDGEVVVAGPRVLAHGGRAVLAVSERLRYGPLKAGYHGGGAPAEAVVPLVLLTPVELAEADGARPAPPQEPAWWSLVALDLPGPIAAPPVPATSTPTLFDEPTSPAAEHLSLGRRVTASAAYAEARALAGRLRITDDQVAKLVDRLAAAPQRRLSLAQAAVVLGVPPSSISGAVEQARKVLNVEGYPVLSREAVTDTVILDVGLLVEQFGVTL